MDAEHVCTYCGLRVLDGEVRFGPTGDHYYCKFPNGQPTIEDARKEADAALQRLDNAIKKLDSIRRKL